MPVDLDQPNIRDLGYLLAEASKTVVFVCGAGVSRSAGVPLWPEFLEKMSAAAVRASSERDPAEGKELKERLAAIKDPWLLGDALHETMARPLYNTTVQALLSPKRKAPVYGLIEKLHPSGVLSFNLDQLAEQALDVRPERRATTLEPSKFQKFLLLSQPFLLQPHGSLADPSSWVLTGRARTALLKKNHEYRRFMANLFGSRRLVVIGFQPTDFAFESLLLEDFREPGASGVHHFWITPTLTGSQRGWAHQYGLETIEYHPAGDDHLEVEETLTHLATFTPRQPAAEFTYDGPSIDPSKLPRDEDLRGEHVEDIRRKLNAGAKGLLASLRNASHEEQLAALERFLDEYSGSAHMAWHVANKPGYDRFFGSRIAEKVGEGTFGHIWRVQDPVDGSTKIVKILRRELAENGEFVEAFRRGVAAGRILTRSKVAGMVRFLESYEIPTCLVMEYIDGPTLAALVQDGQLARLEDAVDVIRSVGQIVHSAHALPERVLHRDLKPSNVMIEGFFSGRDTSSVKVLDFDLSWYEGAAGRSLLGGARYQGYAAPEQLFTRPTGTSTRHTAVDVFGLGMLLYFVLTGHDPEPNAQKERDFEAKTRELIVTRMKSPFGSITGYLASLIRRATCDRQQDRIGLPAFLDGLTLVLKALQEEKLEIPSDLVLIEIQEALAKDGIWKAKPFDGIASQLQAGPGSVVIGFKDRDAAPALSLRIGFNSAGDMRWSTVSKYLETRVDQVKAILRKSGFEVTSASVDGASMNVEAICGDRAFSAAGIRRIVDAVQEAAQKATF